MSTYTNSEDLNYKNMDNSQIPSISNTLSTPKTKAACQTDHIQGMPSSWLTGALNKKKKNHLLRPCYDFLLLHKAVSHMSTDFEAAAL